MRKNKLKSQRGFTLAELLVVIAIIGVISIIAFANYRAGEKQFSLQRSGYKLIQDIRRAQNMAMAARAIGDQVPTGYGIYLISGSPTQYILFADNDGDGLYDEIEDTAMETLSLEAGITIDTLSPVDPLIIAFKPPDPTVSFSDNVEIIEDDEVFITFNYQGGSGKTVSVNKVGLIEIQ